MGRYFASLALALMVAVAGVSFAPAAPAAAEIERWETFHGCIITAGDDFVVMRVHGSAFGPAGMMRFGVTGVTTADTALTQDACIAVVAWQEDGEWYAAAISAEREDEGTIEIRSRRSS
jgi:hypothetical protein